MKQLPILFRTSMVQAILDGRKTMTRRIIKTTQNGWDCQKMNFTQSRNIDKSEITEKYKRQASQIIGFHAFFTDEEHNGHQLGIKCPFGQPGDILWVRETSRKVSHYGFEDPIIEYKAGGNNAHCSIPDTDQFIPMGNWIPSIHMKKEASRIWLQVEEIKVERLQEISEDDAIAEGIAILYPGVFKSYQPATDMPNYSAKESFQELWITINGSDAWYSDPWVWVLKFKILSTTGKPENLNN